MTRQNYIQAVNSISKSTFEQTAIDLFKYQFSNSPVYRQWVRSLKIDPINVQKIENIPCLPISAFKQSKVISGKVESQIVYSSSGTTSAKTSQHFVHDRKAYLSNAVKGFNEFYGNVSEYCILALLPSYLEREGSSLIDMVDHFIGHSNYDNSVFFLYNHEELYHVIRKCKSQNIPTILFGVSFALLDFVEKYEIDFPELIIMETGGMKGRREELSREQLHNSIKVKFNVPHVHSEYGMTELLSQAYSNGKGIFRPSSTMRVLTRDITDPFALVEYGRSGIISIIDLANIDSCCFIETEDIGIVYHDNSFEVLGRLDKADIRGCNLMVSDI